MPYLPNEEVKYIFRRKVLSWFDQKVKQKDRTRLLQAVVDGDAETVEEEIGEMLLETIILRRVPDDVFVHLHHLYACRADHQLHAVHDHHLEQPLCL